MRIRKKWVLGIVLSVVILGIGAFVYDAENAYPPEAGPHTEAQGIDRVAGAYRFPSDGEIGLVLYPGARVDARAYFPLARALQAEGIETYVVDFFLNYAFFSPGAYEKVVAEAKNKAHWILAGHSLGGAMMAAHAASGPQPAPDGLVFLSAYPADAEDLKGFDGWLLFISPSNDRIATPEEIRERSSDGSKESTWVNIRGGNHAGYAAYGPQAGDGAATIGREEQIDQTVEAIQSVVTRNDL